jgi:hypothetical protein
MRSTRRWNRVSGGIVEVACIIFTLALLLTPDYKKSSTMPLKPETIIKQTRKRIARIQETLGGFDYLCSGTLLKRTKVCGKPGCRCAQDVKARHGPYYEWGHMQGGKLVHRVVTAQQAALLQLAINNNRSVQKLLRDWEVETERLIDAEAPRKL